MKATCENYTKTNCNFCEVCAHLFGDCDIIILVKPPIHYIVFATPHKKKYLLQKRQSKDWRFYYTKIEKKQLYISMG